MKNKKSTEKAKEFKLPQPMTDNQRKLVNYIMTKEMVITTGCAGTGKTFLSMAYAAYFYKKGNVDKIVLTRPNIPTGKSIGFFPGDLLEKMAPWTAPLISVLELYLSKGEVECMIKNGKIEIVPFEVIRGRTFDNAFVVLDEAQNTTYQEIKAFVTRIGENSRVVVNGDINQSDLSNSVNNGLSTLLTLISLKKNQALRDNVAHVEFTSDDVVRSGLCKLWVKAFS